MTDADVSSAFGKSIPEVPPAGTPRPTWFLCEFSAIGDEANTDLVAAAETQTVTVSSFPFPSQHAKTPKQLYSELEALGSQMAPKEREESIGELVEEPEWGDGAFMALISNAPNSGVAVQTYNAELWLPHTHVAISTPGSMSELKSAATSIGNIAAQAE